MARKKTITSDQILNAAFELVAEQGFSKFTARNIASQMNCSTQPIYLEFENMQHLKETLFDKIQNYLKEEVFNRVVTGDPLMDLNLNYIRFATEETTLYRALYVEGHSAADDLNEFSRELCFEGINHNPELSKLSEDTKDAVFSAMWIVSTGIASLQSGDLIKPTQDQTIQLLNDVISSVLDNHNPQIMTNKRQKPVE